MPLKFASTFFLLVAFKWTPSCGVSTPMVHVGRMGNDTSCSPGGSACKTISRGLEVAVEHGVVVVAPGRYSGLGNCKVSIKRPVTLISSQGQGETIWDCEHKSRCLVISANATVEGFTFQQGFVAPIANCSDFEDSEKHSNGGKLENKRRSRQDSGLLDSAATPDVPVKSQRMPGPVKSQRMPGPVAFHHSLGRSAAQEVRDLVGVSGGCILAMGDGISVKIRHSAILGGTAPHGGGVALHGTQALLSNVSVAGNSAEWGGGVLAIGGTLQIVSSVISNNAAMNRGAAMWPDKAAVGAGVALFLVERADIHNSSIAWNMGTACGQCGETYCPTATGGGISCRDGNVSLTSSEVTNNSVTSFGSGSFSVGGGIYSFSGIVSVSSSHVASNSLRGTRVFGGGINMEFGIVAVSSSHVSSNSLSGKNGFGGGIYSFSGIVSVSSSHVTLNCLHGTAQGGGIWSSTGTVSVLSSHVTSNFLSGRDVFGGGIYSSSGNVSVSSSHVSSNYLRSDAQASSGALGASGGGIYSLNSNIYVFSSHLTSNSLYGRTPKGGGIFSYEGNVSVSSSHVTFNSLSGQNVYGGGIYSSGCSISVSSSRVTSNSLSASGSSGVGGGMCLYAATAHMAVTFSEVSSNSINCTGASCLAKGGGIYMELQAAVALSGTISLLSSHFVQNFVSSGSGGAAAITSKASEVAMLHNCTFLGNRVLSSNRDPANGVGGAILLLGARVQAQRSLFFGNVATSSGGAIALIEDGFVNITMCNFFGNSVNLLGVGGGALFFDGTAEGSIENSTFVNNSAGTGGGAIVTFGIAAIQVFNAVFERNKQHTSFLGGGAVVIASSGNTMFQGCNFTSNIAIGSGGAVFTSRNGGGTFAGCRFAANMAMSSTLGGGAMALTGAQVSTLVTCEAFQNQALSGSGGALVVQPPGQAKAVGSQFYENSAGAGEAIAVNPNSNVTVRSSSFSHNSLTIFGGSLESSFNGVLFSRSDTGFHGSIVFAGCGFHDSSVFPESPSRGSAFSITGSAFCGASRVSCPDAQVLVEGAGDIHVDPGCGPQPRRSSAVVVPIGAPGVPSRVPGCLCGGSPDLSLSFVTSTHMNDETSMAVWTLQPQFGLMFMGELSMSLYKSSTSLSSDTNTSVDLAPGDLITRNHTEKGRNASLSVNLLHQDLASQFFAVEVTMAALTHSSGPVCFWLELEQQRPRLGAVHVSKRGSSSPLTGQAVIIQIAFLDERGNPYRLSEKVTVHSSHGHMHDCEDLVGVSSKTCTLTTGLLFSTFFVTFHLSPQHDTPVHGQLTIFPVWLIGTLSLVGGGVLALVLRSSIVRLKKYRQAQIDHLLEGYTDLEAQQQRTERILSNFVRLEPADHEGTTPLLLQQQLVVPYEQVTILRDVAAGATAKVSLGSWRHTQIAVKRFFDLPGADLDALIKECAVHHGLHHPNVVQLLGICQAPLCLLTEWMGRGSLFALLQAEHLELPWSRRLKFALDTARGMHYLHSAGLLHRDLKSKNILIDHGWNAKVCDFGLATKDASVHTASVLGTVLWSAPELFERTGHYNQSADVYSFGIVLWELWTRAAPYSANPDMPRGWAAIDYIRTGARPLPPADAEACPPWYEKLMTESWTTDPAERPGFGSVVSTLEQDGSSGSAAQSAPPKMDAGGNDLETPLLVVTGNTEG